MPLILIIDDEPSVRGAMRRLLEHAEFDVCDAPTAERALQLASGTPTPDCILQDLMLPDMDGFELTARLRELPQLIGVPIICVSAYLPASEAGRAARVGFTDYIGKPYDSDRLVSMIHAHLSY